MSTLIDLTSVETAAFAAAEGHVLLRAFVGSWSGPTKLWLDPHGPPEETRTTLQAEPLLGGRWLRLSYRELRPASLTSSVVISEGESVGAGAP